MIQAVQLDMSMTLGDLVVVGGSILAIVICFFAMKATLETISASLSRLNERCDGYDDKLEEHGEGLAALDAAVFGRRRQDSAAARQRRLHPKET